MRIIFPLSSPHTSLFQKIIRLLVGLVVIGVALTIAAFLFVYIVVFAVAILGYLWWKTRKLRQAIRNASQRSSVQDSDAQGGNVIEGEVIRETRIISTVLRAK